MGKAKIITEEMVRGSYKKLKTYYFYNKNMNFVKRKIANFEANGKIESIFKEIADSFNGNTFKDYFKEKISLIKFRALPKKVKEKNINKDSVIITNKPQEFCVDKVNLFIDLPIELMIVDVMWSLEYSNLLQKSNRIIANSYGNKIDIEKVILGKNVNYANNKFFVNYKYSYSEWNKKCFETVSNIYLDKTKRDSFLIRLDIKSFFYKVAFSFTDLREYIPSELTKKYDDLKHLEEIIKQIFEQFKLVVEEVYKTDLEDEKYFLPIGLFSSNIIANQIMYTIDNQIINGINPKTGIKTNPIPRYYGRYVDDTLIVYDEPAGNLNAKDIKKNDLIEKYLNGIIECGEKKCFYSGLNLELNEDKTQCYIFYFGDSNYYIDVDNTKKQIIASEENDLFEDEEIDLKENIWNEKKSIANVDGSTNQDIVKKIFQLCFILKDSEEILDGSYNELKNRIDNLKKQINLLSNTNEIINYRTIWSYIFEFLIIVEDFNNIKNIYTKIISEIGKADYQGDQFYNNEKVGENLKKSLKDELDISLAVACALIGKKNLEDRSQDYKKNFEESRKIREANLFNHKLLSLPLINYLKGYEEDYIFKKLSKKGCFNFKIDEQKKIYSPRDIYLEEWMCSFYFKKYNKLNEITTKDLNGLVKKYYKTNSYSSDSSTIKIEEGKKKINELKYNVIAIKDCDEKDLPSKLKIAIGNLKINSKDVLDNLISNVKPNEKEKVNLFKMLEIAKKNDSNYILLPEYYLPWEWVMDVCDFSKKNEVGVVTGLKPFRNSNGIVVNAVLNIQPFRDQKKYKSCFIIIREKNDYSPLEKESLLEEGCFCYDVRTPLYYLVDYKSIRYTTMLCYELTDIFSRAMFRGEIDLMFVPELNKDTKYFSNIVESLVRDLHCFLAQSNTSIYGDSRITAPYNGYDADILKIKGGDNDLIIVGTIDIGSVKKYQDVEKKYLFSCFSKNSGLTPQQKKQRMRLYKRYFAIYCQKPTIKRTSARFYK